MRRVKGDVITLYKVRRTTGNSNQVHEPDAERNCQTQIKGKY